MTLRNSQDDVASDEAKDFPWWVVGYVRLVVFS
jgi:hypothetical protein